jgi:GrpB-like predicted nucleotidyltransferase (UPF0157 family)
VADDATSDEGPFPGLIGPPELHESTIYLAPYDPTWPDLYDSEERRIRAALGNLALQVEHVGSTSVPGLSAKPIIDIDLVVADTTDETAYVPALVNAGYVLRGREPDWHQHRLFRGTHPKVNLHVFTLGCREIPRMLEFRDLLRSNDGERDLYLRRKQELAAQTWKYVQNYADAKSDVVEDIIGRTTAAGATCVKY